MCNVCRPETMCNVRRRVYVGRRADGGKYYSPQILHVFHTNFNNRPPWRPFLLHTENTNKTNLKVDMLNSQHRMHMHMHAQRASLKMEYSSFAVQN